MAFGRVNPQFRLEDQGITGLDNVHYNLIEPALIEAALRNGEGRLGRGGTFLVSFTLFLTIIADMTYACGGSCSHSGGQ